MSTRAIATSTLWQMGSQAAMAVLSAISVKLVAMGLSKELAGSYNLTFGYLQLFAILADFGLYAVSVRELSTSKQKERVLGGLLVLRICIMCLSLGAAVLISWCIPAWQNTPLPVGIVIASFVPFFTLLAGVLRTVFQVTYNMHIVFIAEVSQRLLMVALMAAIIFMGVRQSESILVYELFLFVGSVGAFSLFVISLFFATRMMRIRPVFDRALLRHLFLQAAPYGVAFLCIALYRQFDMTMIALLREDFLLQNASYGFASRLTEMTYLVPTLLLNSTLPILSDRAGKRERASTLLGTTLLAVLSFGSLSALFSFFWATPLMRLLTTDAYLATPGQPGADTALHFLAAPMFLNGIVLFCFYILLATHHWKPLVMSMLAAVALSITLNLQWIPTGGFLGAIRTATVVHLFLVLVLFPQAVRSMPFSISFFSLARFCVFILLVGCTAAFATPFLLSTSSILIGLFLGAIWVLVAGYLTGLFALFYPSKGGRTG